MSFSAAQFLRGGKNCVWQTTDDANAQVVLFFLFYPFPFDWLWVGPAHYQPVKFPTSGVFRKRQSTSLGVWGGRVSARTLNDTTQSNTRILAAESRVLVDVSLEEW